MAVHRVKVQAAEDAANDKATNKISDLKGKYGEKLPKENNAFGLSSTLDGTSYYDATFIVYLAQDSKAAEKNDLTEQIEKELDKSASSWRVRYHVCDHDEESSEGCNWDYENSAGTVPL